MMKLLFAFCGLSLALLISGCYEKGEGNGTGPIYRHQFVGMTEILRGTNASKLKEIWGLPSTAEMRQQTLDKLALAPREFWRKQLPADAPNQKELIRPLLDDLFTAESYFDVRGPVSRPEAVLALRLSKERLALWNTNLWKTAAGWKCIPQPAQVGSLKGWEAKRADGGLVQVVVAGEWVMAGVGREKLTLLPALAAEAGKTGRPVTPLAQGTLLSMDTDFTKVKTWFPFLATFKMPPSHIELIGRGEYVRTEMRMRFSGAIPWKFEAWKIPTNVIKEPLASFTVGQGIAPLLPEIKGMKQLGLTSYPNQFCAWSLGTEHFVNFAAMPIANPSNVIGRIAPQMPDFIKQYFADPSGQIALQTNRNELIWRGLPMMAPFIRPIKSGGTEYALAGSLPLGGGTNAPPPPELLAQFMGRNNLMYYDWEITEQALLHARQMMQIVDILQHRRLAGTNAASSRWTFAMARHLGNSITEVTQTAPNELSLVRKSHVGFTGFELVMLARWLDAPSFPFGYEPPAKVRQGVRPPGVGTKAPRAVAPRPGVVPPKPR